MSDHTTLYCTTFAYQCLLFIIFAISMSNNREAVAFANAIQYFKISLSSSTQSKQFQINIDVISSVLHQPSIILKFTPDALFGVLQVLSQRFYQLAKSKESIIKEEYLLNKFVGFLLYLFKEVSSKQISYGIMKNLLLLLTSSDILLIKSTFQGSQKMNELRTTLLQFLLVLLRYIKLAKDIKIQDISAQPFSICNWLLNKHSLTIKHFALCLEILMILIQNNPCFCGTSPKGVNFQVQCYKRVVQDIKLLINNYNKFELPFRDKIKNFASFLLQMLKQTNNKKDTSMSNVMSLCVQVSQLQRLKRQMFTQTILLAQLNQLNINLQNYNLYERSIIQQSYKQLYLDSCKLLTVTQFSIEVKKRQMEKLSYLIPILNFINSEDELTLVIIKLFKHLFTIKKDHQLITIPHHATTIPLEPLKPEHTQTNYPVKQIYSQFHSQFSRMIVEVIPFYQLQNQLLVSVESLFKSLNFSSRSKLLQHFSQQLLQFDYRIDMSVTKLYNYLQSLFILKFILSHAPTSPSLPNAHIYSLFQTLASKSQAVKSLRASYIEEELLIAVTLQIINECIMQLRESYEENDRIRGKIKMMQHSILMVEKIINELSEESYLIRLITLHMLLQFAGTNTISQKLTPLQSALIHRNKNNLSFIYSLLQITHLNHSDYEQLASYYVAYKNSQIILRYLLPFISIESGRTCILAVEKWWLLLTRQVIQWLNCKQMVSAKQKTDNFAVIQGPNVRIANALGVIILQLNQKWIFYLRSQKREVIIDIIADLLQVNCDMVFFHSFFSKIMNQLYLILRECFGYQKEQLPITCKRSKKKNDNHSEDRKEIKIVEFYNRLRFKIYNLLAKFPSQNYKLWQQIVINNLRSLINLRYDQVRSNYLFFNKLDQQQEYQLLKTIVQKLTSVNSSQSQ